MKIKKSELVGMIKEAVKAFHDSKEIDDGPGEPLYRGLDYPVDATPEEIQAIYDSEKLPQLSHMMYPEKEEMSDPYHLVGDSDGTEEELADYYAEPKKVSQPVKDEEETGADPYDYPPEL